MMKQLKPVSLFFSYAPEDEKLRDELEKHLKLLQHQGIIATWYNRQVMAGTSWAEKIDAHLNEASIILLLISPDFLASDYCYKSEMRNALERHRLGRALVIPIILRPVDWQGSPFVHLQYLPANARPITLWDNQDAAFQEVAKGIRQAVEYLYTTPSTSQPEMYLGEINVLPKKLHHRRFMLIGAVIVMLLLTLFGSYVYINRAGLSSSSNNVLSGSKPTATSSRSMAGFIPQSWHEKEDALSANSDYYNWDEGDGLYRNCQFKDNSYYVGIEGGAVGYAFCLASTSTEFTNFAFQVDMKDSGGTGGGIVFHFGNNNGYYFCVQYKGENQVIAFVKAYSNGKFSTLKIASLSDLNIPFSKNPKDLNALAVVVQGNTFTFFVNEEKVMQMSDSKYNQGEIGLGAGNAADQLSYAGVEMSNAKLWAP